MKISLFSQSLFALDLETAIRVTGEIGYEAIEVACFGPHLRLDQAREERDRIMGWIKAAGLEVSALSLSNDFVREDRRAESVQSTIGFIRLARGYETGIVKITPGGPSSLEATEADFEIFQEGIQSVCYVARKEGIRVVMETHLRQLSDTTASTVKLLEMGEAEVLGVNLDLCNVAFGGDDPVQSIRRLKDRLYFTHIKNGYLRNGTYDFRRLDDGVVDYPRAMAELRRIGYKGYLSIECLGEEARTHPRETPNRLPRGRSEHLWRLWVSWATIIMISLKMETGM